MQNKKAGHRYKRRYRLHNEEKEKNLIRHDKAPFLNFNKTKKSKPKRPLRHHYLTPKELKNPLHSFRSISITLTRGHKC